MKYKSYGDIQEGIEIIDNNDLLSSRSINRPVINLYENQEEIYKLLNTLLKTTYGNVTNSIIDNIYENFSNDKFEIVKLNSLEEYYLRLPTGSLFLQKNNKFINDKDKSFVWNNFPTINIFERQLADIIDLDLSDQNNNIRINLEEKPKVIPIFILNEDLTHKINSKNNILYLQKDEHRLFETDHNNAKFYIPNVEESTEGPYVLDDSELTEIIPDEAEEKGKFLTDDYDKATKVEGKDLCYSFEVDMNDQYGFKKESFPGNKQNAYWDISLPDIGDKGQPDKSITLFLNILKKNELDDDYNIVQKYNISFKIKGFNSSFKLNNLLMEKILQNGLLNAEMIEDKLRISFKENDSKYDNYKLSISKKEGEEEAIELPELNKISVSGKSKKQSYFYNAAELYNFFVDYYNIYINRELSNVINALRSEIFVKIPSDVENNIFIYYDLNNNEENGKLEDYDNTGKIKISKTDIEADNLIKLCEITLNKGIGVPSINTINVIPKILNSYLFKPKDIEADTLNISNKTILNNDTTIKSGNNIIINNNLGTKIESDNDSSITNNNTNNEIKFGNNTITNNASGTIIDGATNIIQSNTNKITNDASGTIIQSGNGSSITNDVSGTTIQSGTDSSITNDTSGTTINGATNIIQSGSNKITNDASGTTIKGTTTINGATTINNNNLKVTDGSKGITIGSANITVDGSGNIKFSW